MERIGAPVAARRQRPRFEDEDGAGTSDVASVKVEGHRVGGDEELRIGVHGGGGPEKKTTARAWWRKKASQRRRSLDTKAAARGRRGGTRCGANYGALGVRAGEELPGGGAELGPGTRGGRIAKGGGWVGLRPRTRERNKGGQLGSAARRKPKERAVPAGWALAQGDASHGHVRAQGRKEAGSAGCSRAKKGRAAARLAFMPAHRKRI